MKTKRPALFASIAAILALSNQAALAKSGWLDNYDKALEKAKNEKKMVLIDFTGSDWCGWCIKLDKEVFSKKEFKDYAKDKYVLLEIDFPQLKRLSKSKQEEHDALAQKFGVQGYPTIVVLDANGEAKGTLGYVKGGPEAFIQELEKVSSKPGGS